MDGSNPGADTKTRALEARYGADALPAAGPWNATLDLLLSHRSVRGYRTDASLPEGTLETMIAAAQSAATSSNLQTWSVIVVDDPVVRAELAEVANNQKHILQVPLFMVFLADASRNARMAEQEGVELAGQPFMETFLVAAIDAALAAQNAVVAAESLGLSTVYIGALRNDPERVARLLNLPPQVMGVFGLCVGHAREGAEGEVKPRLPQSVIVHHGRYDSANEQAERADYDARMTAFTTRNEMATSNWTQRVISRLGTFKALSGRDKMRAAIEALGFPLR
ncbi:nitroreductase family protein [Plastoroseomonas arctica]|uniref:NADPH-dependent oxidoreductase n=1 Tax=Plastoroseomonas arctica TaxID=1509237 RepID=A0AAF1KU80_9PROT|nr:nitroreductase family protein [Plastoroseomonas arctica]MBR0655677.1 NADPH-dependent oxidoreductase [Plastoroseomonas arctica]